MGFGGRLAITATRSPVCHRFERRFPTGERRFSLTGNIGREVGAKSSVMIRFMIAIAIGYNNPLRFMACAIVFAAIWV